jgi:hypothetical protein
MVRDEPLIFIHLKLVAKISLAVGAIAVLGLMLSMSLIRGLDDASYFAAVRSSSITREQIGPVMLAIGLALVAIAGIITWLIALYSSFRIAGPLYRFSQNLKLATASDDAALLDLRSDDTLIAHSDRIKQAVGTLRAHYAALEQHAEAASAALERGDAAAYEQAVSALRAIDEKAHF